MSVAPATIAIVAELEPGDAAVLLAALEVLPGTPQDLSELLEVAGSPAKLLDSFDALSKRESELLLFLRKSLDGQRVAYWRRSLADLCDRRPEVRLIPVTDHNYPAELKKNFDRPPFVFVDTSNAVHELSSIAIVGSRLASEEALRVASALAMLSVRQDLLVVSGLARGVDAAAHEGALKGGGQTVAVLGAGIDSALYPPEHRSLAECVRERGSLISQFQPFAPATRSSFVLRNSVISGMSKVSFVVQAEEKSGTRTEVEAALRQDKKVVFWAPLMKDVPWAEWYSHLKNVSMTSDLDYVVEMVLREAGEDER